MPKWLDLNEVDDDEILLKKNRMSRSLGEEEYDNIFYD